MEAGFICDLCIIVMDVSSTNKLSILGRRTSKLSIFISLLMWRTGDLWYLKPQFHINVIHDK